MSTVPLEPESEYDAIPFSTAQYALMKELFQSAFGSAITEANFKKRFDTTMFGEEVIGFLAIHRQTKKPAAYYGVFPVRLWWQNKIMLAAQSGDTMTHEQHRKKGLFIWLAQKTFSKCKEKGIALVFGLPNENSYPGFTRRLQWVQLDNITTYDLKLKRKTIPLAKLAIKAGLFSIYLKLAKGILSRQMDDSVKQFHNPLKQHSRVYRDADYLRYKAADNKFFLQLNGVKAWVSLTDVLWVGDLDNYDTVNEATISQLKRLAFWLGYNTIRFHFNDSLPQPAFLQWFDKRGQEPSCFYYLDDQLKGTNLLLTAADFDTW